MNQRLSGRVSQTLVLLPLAILLAGTSSAQTRRNSSRIDPSQIDNDNRVTLPGSVHPRTHSATRTGRPSASLGMDRMLLMLKSSPEQEAALESLLAAQQDPASPKYRQWLSAEQFGQQFGPSQADVTAVQSWLQQQGFTVDHVSPSRRAIEFSGDVQHVEKAFGTVMSEYSVNGARHIANATEISLPAALTGVVAGVVSLNDFHPVPLHHRTPAPLTDLSNGAHALSPYDFAAIYDVAPLWKNGIDGTGQTIAIVGRTNINQSDVASFRSQFGLTGNNTQVIVNGTDPGVVSQSEATEALLDVEWSGAVAKGATIAFVVSANTASSGGDVLSAQYIVDNKTGSVMSYSFGLCESLMGSENSYFNSLWQQAAAEGITVLAAAGDSGSAGCDVPGDTSKAATAGLAVSGIASTPYNVAVGGTEFNDSANPSAYWNAANDANHASATGYIPEVVWNESSYTSAGASTNGLWAGGGGVSTIYATPSWQAAPGVPAVDPGTSAGHHRYVPDVSLSGAGHDSYLIVQNGSLYGVGGTSAASPAFAGIIALANQQAKGSTGNAGPALYSLASKVPSAFHDVTGGSNAVPCAAGSPGCLTSGGSATGTLAGFSAGPGYDLATGLGSVDAFNLVMNWPSGVAAKAAAPAITNLNPNPMAGSSSAQTLTIGGSGFVSGASVTLTAPGASPVVFQGAQVSFGSSTQLSVSVNVGTAAQAWSVVVTNPDGQSSAAASLNVTAPAQTAALSITSMSPNPFPATTPLKTLTINGTGFTGSVSLQMSPSKSASGARIASVSVVSSTQMKVSLTLGTVPQTWTVQISANGNTSNRAALSVQ